MCTTESLDNLFPKIQLKQKSFNLIKFLRIEDPVYAGKCNAMHEQARQTFEEIGLVNLITKKMR